MWGCWCELALTVLWVGQTLVMVEAGRAVYGSRLCIRVAEHPGFGCLDLLGGQRPVQLFVGRDQLAQAVAFALTLCYLVRCPTLVSTGTRRVVCGLVEGHVRGSLVGSAGKSGHTSL